MSDQSDKSQPNPFIYIDSHAYTVVIEVTAHMGIITKVVMDSATAREFAERIRMAAKAAVKMQRSRLATAVGRGDVP